MECSPPGSSVHAATTLAKNLNVIMSGVGKYVEPQELSSVMGRNADWYRHILAISKKMEDIHIL